MDLVELTAVFFCVFAKHALHGPGLDRVAQRRGSAVRVDVIDLLGIIFASRIVARITR